MDQTPGRWVLTHAAHPAHQAGAEPPLLPGEKPPLHRPQPGMASAGSREKRQHLGKGLLAAPPAPGRVWTDEFWVTAPPTEPLPTRGALGAGSGRSSSAASPPTSHRHARSRLLPGFGKSSQLGKNSRQRRAELRHVGKKRCRAVPAAPKPGAIGMRAQARPAEPGTARWPRLLACFSSSCFPVNCTRDRRDNAGLFSALPPGRPRLLPESCPGSGALEPRSARGEITGAALSPPLSPPLFLFC